jgi:hypothetical protein
MVLGLGGGQPNGKSEDFIYLDLLYIVSSSF